MKYSLKKKVLVVGLNYDQIPFINIIKKIGLLVIGVDINSKAPGIKYCDMFYNTSYENYEKISLYLKKNKFSSNDYLDDSKDDGLVLRFKDFFSTTRNIFSGVSRVHNQCSVFDDFVPIE